ncbi:hypothetical protein OHB24_18095 [Kribbella sp. NBC_00482]|uniref:hypothetical protein n=1 Tax=Kribbella sp. NBC_00482 TaxID=2975968 RepID=UPI002E18815A
MRSASPTPARTRLARTLAWLVLVLVLRRTRVLGLSSVGPTPAPSMLLLLVPAGVEPLGRVGLAVLDLAVVGQDGVLQLGRRRLGSRLAAVVR